jgi:nucleotide-binding universal stress UspA family protein
MKKILVPTDFSSSAENATFYALDLAKTINANLLLCNAITIPAAAPMAAQVAWPLVDYNTLQNEVTRDFELLTQKMKKGDVAADLSAYPDIKYQSKPGSVIEVVKELVEKEKASLVVMGMSGAGMVSRLFLGSSSRDMIDKANFPVLLVPHNATFNGIHKIAFATDLSENDIEVIHYLAGFAYNFNADILIAHVSAEEPDNVFHQKKINTFLNDITCKINYPKIYYRHIKQQDVDQGLDWLTVHGLIDMLVMVHRHNNLIDSLFNRSHTQKVAKHINIPLLVYPGKTWLMNK